MTQSPAGPVPGEDGTEAPDPGGFRNLSDVCLRTRRLILRPPCRTDADAIASALADWEVVRMLASVPWPYGIADALAYFETAATELAAGTDLYLLIEEESGVVGAIGFHELLERPALGYWLARRAWGRGYATEAAAAVLAFGFDRLGLAAVRSGFFVGNDGSARVQQKLGFVEIGRSQVFCLARGIDMDHVDTILEPDRFRRIQP